jgi:hypothetical protein
MILNWCHREPTLEDILSDSITKAVMEADGVDPQQLAAMLKEVERRWAAHARFGMLADNCELTDT